MSVIIVLITLILIAYCTFNLLMDVMQEAETKSKALAQKETLSILKDWEIEILKMKIKTIENTKILKH